MGPRRSLCRRVGGARALERGFGQVSLPWAHGRFPLYLLKPEHFLQQEGPPSSLTEETEAPGRGLARGLAQLLAVVRLSSCHQPFARPLLPVLLVPPPASSPHPLLGSPRGARTPRILSSIFEPMPRASFLPRSRARGRHAASPRPLPPLLNHISSRFPHPSARTPISRPLTAPHPTSLMNVGFPFT